MRLVLLACGGTAARDLLLVGQAGNHLRLLSRCFRADAPRSWPFARNRRLLRIALIMTYRTTYGAFPTSATLLFGIGLGGFFDGIVFHQVLQWHHMVSTWYPPTSLDNLRINTRWDGFFHSATYLFVVWGIVLFWRTASSRELYWSLEMLLGGLLLGWGAFNVVEGLVDHTLLGVHHVNETVAVDKQPYWDLGFLAWGASMCGAGWWLYRQGNGRRQVGSRPPLARPKVEA
jgi:uncharacterized membrane protein